MLFSIVTVCFNASNLIEKTIKSVLAQDFSDYEYIIQDGGSTDDTLEIINKFKGDFEMRNIPYIINSGRDKGIYDAMNKAVSTAHGEYIIFMNADDCFYSKSVLSSVYSSLKTYELSNKTNTPYSDNASLPDIVYGDCIVKELGMYFKFRKHYELIKERMPFSHQSCFAKRDLLLKWPFDLSFPITADYNFLLKCHMNKCVFHDSEVIISLVTADGVSSVNMFDAFTEACKVCDLYNIPRYTEKEMKNKIHEMKIKQFVLSFFPTFIKKSIRKYQITHRGQSIEVTIPSWAND